MPDNKTTNDDNVSTVIGHEHLTQDVNTDERYSVGGADHREQVNHMNFADSWYTRRQEQADAEQRRRHTEDQHQQRLRHAEDLHTINVQTLQVGSVGSSRIIEDIANQTADAVIAAVETKVGRK